MQGFKTLMIICHSDICSHLFTQGLFQVNTYLKAFLERTQGYIFKHFWIILPVELCQLTWYNGFISKAELPICQFYITEHLIPVYPPKNEEIFLGTMFFFVFIFVCLLFNVEGETTSILQDTVKKKKTHKDISVFRILSYFLD